MLVRADSSLFAEWRRNVDLYLVAGLITIALLGVVLSFAGSPPVAERIGAGITTLANQTRSDPDSFYFIKKHVIFFILSIPVLFGISLLNTRSVQYLMLCMFCVSLILLVVVLFTGSELRGAKRWISIYGISIQPSEFVKPSFIVISSWLLSEEQINHHFPGRLLSFILLSILTTLLLLEPDIGQLILIIIAWLIVFYVSGIPIRWATTLCALWIGGAYTTYLTFPHFARRLTVFVNEIIGNINQAETGRYINFQVARARDSFLSGGWFGRGPGEGMVKWTLPDSHSDFIFAVLGEEFGIVMCLLLVAMINLVVLRSIYHATKSDTLFRKYAITGLTSLFYIQSVINIAVNLRLAPATGMTLPLISYGGTSMVATMISMGCLIALCRHTQKASYTGSYCNVDILGSL